MNPTLIPAGVPAVPALNGAAATELELALPKGRMQSGVVDLLAAAGIDVSLGARAYRPVVSLPGARAKLLKPQNIVQMLRAGARDAGFCGYDWALETRGTAADSEPVELLDTGLDPVRIVAAAPAELLGPDGELPDRPLVVASEYESIAARWIAERGIDARILRTYGATEVFPPEDADLIVDNTATGSTLRANGLLIVDEVLRSSTRLFASRAAMEDPSKRARLDELVLLLRSVLDARSRVMLEVNVSGADLDRVVEALPSMRCPTVSELGGSAGFAVRAAVPRA
ncbi:MAG: ATP phosphoribosyltransferase, partial [Planctomycetota bacterium]